MLFCSPFSLGQLKTLKEVWQSCRPKRDQRVAEGRGGLPALGGRIRMEVGRPCLGFLPGKHLLKSKGLLEKKKKIKHSHFHCIHPSKKSARALKELITIMLDNQSRECTGKSYSANTGCFPKCARKHISHSPLTRRLTFFNKCRPLWPILHLLWGRLPANSIQPFLLLFSSSCRNENQGSQPRCITSTYSSVGT